LAYGFLFVFFVACGGEEISWFQRILHYDGASAIINVNKQGELNLRDVGHISIFSNSFFLLFLAVFFAYPYIVMRSETAKRLVRENDLPILGWQAAAIAALTLLVWGILGVRFGTLGFHPYSLYGYYTQMDDEVFELLAAFSFFSFVLLDSHVKRALKRRAAS
jgi:hypothetical protein